jgi:polyhydroxybutyrate depolymerase
MRALLGCSCLGLIGLTGLVTLACGTSASTGAGAPVSGGNVGPGSGGVQPGDDAGALGEPTEDGGSASPPASGDDAGAGTDAGTPAAALCSGTSQWSPGGTDTITIDVGDAGARSYLYYVGTGVKPGSAVPLVVNMHGLTNTPQLQEQFSQMNPVADTNGFVVVYPAGLNASFNAGNCCGESAAAGVDDVGFVRAVVADAESRICIDPKRVYETGFSNGGMMAYQLACNAADLFAAVAPTEGSNETNTPCNPSRPVPLAAFEYLGDPIVVPASAQASVDGWANQMGCPDAGATTTMQAAFTCQEWSQCANADQVWYCTLPGGTHYPPAGSAPVIWSFLSQFSLP